MEMVNASTVARLNLGQFFLSLRVNGETLQGFVRAHTEPGATIYTDDAVAYRGLALDFANEAVNHTVSEYVRGQAHMNGMEPFQSMLKRAHDGTFHKISPGISRGTSANSRASKHNHRESGTLVQMQDTVARLLGRNLLYRDLIADNGHSSGAEALQIPQQGARHRLRGWCARQVYYRIQLRSVFHSSSSSSSRRNFHFFVRIHNPSSVSSKVAASRRAKAT